VLGAAALLFVLLGVVTAFVMFAFLALFVRAVIWLVLFPVRLLFWLLFLPLLLVKVILGMVFGLVVLPILAFAGVVIAGLLGAALVIPFAPLLLVIAVVFWLLKKDRPAAQLPARTV
jgi:hypothetical protein